MSTVDSSPSTAVPPHEGVSEVSVPEQWGGPVSAQVASRPSRGARLVEDRYLLVLADLVAVTAGVFTTPSSWRLMVFFGFTLVLLFRAGGLHRDRLSLSVLDELPAFAGRSLAAAAIATAAEMCWVGGLRHDYTLDWRFLGGATTVAALVVLLRACVYAAVRRMRSRGLVAHRTLIIGAGNVGTQVADILSEHREYGLHPIGFLDADPRNTGGDSGLPVFGGPERLAAVLERQEVRNVVVAFSSLKESGMVELIRTSDRHRCELFVVPRLFELHQVDHDMDTIWGLPLIRLRRATYRTSAWHVKRAMDIALSSLALLGMAPSLLLVALAVRLSGGPGVLFRQERVGVDGRPFTLLKFRSMRPADETDSATTWNISHDERLGRLGRFLRRTSIDELPQLLNVLKGDMSLVGPRPERPHFVSQFKDAYPSYHARHRVPSGLTGWAQIHGLRGDTSIADRARFDNYYIENWSLWLDVKILLRTVAAVVCRPGA